MRSRLSTLTLDIPVMRSRQIESCQPNQHWTAWTLGAHPSPPILWPLVVLTLGNLRHPQGPCPSRPMKVGRTECLMIFQWVTPATTKTGKNTHAHIYNSLMILSLAAAERSCTVVFLDRRHQADRYCPPTSSDPPSEFVLAALSPGPLRQTNKRGNAKQRRALKQ